LSTKSLNDRGDFRFWHFSGPRKMSGSSLANDCQRASLLSRSEKSPAEAGRGSPDHLREVGAEGVVHHRMKNGRRAYSSIVPVTGGLAKIVNAGGIIVGAKFQHSARVVTRRCVDLRAIALTSEKNAGASAARASRAPPALREPRHRCLARRLVAVSYALSSEMKMPEVCDLENHKCDNGDDQECRQCNQFMPCIKHPIASNSSA
jgi:hypothetical protein